MYEPEMGREEEHWDSVEDGATGRRCLDMMRTHEMIFYLDLAIGTMRRKELVSVLKLRRK